MELQKISLSKLNPSEYNPRIHDSEFLESLERSIDEFGYIDPIIWNKTTGHVVGGHARLKVLKKKKVKEAEVVVIELDENKEKALNIALNKIGGEFDIVALSKLLDELKVDEGLLSMTGFSEKELENMLDLNVDEVLPNFNFTQTQSEEDTNYNIQVGHYRGKIDRETFEAFQVVYNSVKEETKKEYSGDIFAEIIRRMQ